MFPENIKLVADFSELTILGHEEIMSSHQPEFASAHSQQQQLHPLILNGYLQKPVCSKSLTQISNF